MSEDKEYIQRKIIVDELQRIEEKYKLLEYKVSGWSIWPILRHSLGLSISNYPINPAKRKRNLDLVKYAVKDFFSILFLKKSRYLVKTYTSARGEKVGDYYKDIYFDDLLYEIKDFYKIEAINNYRLLNRSKKALIKSNMTNSFIEIVSGLFSYLKIGPKEINNISCDLARIINQEFRIDGFSPERICRRLLHFYWGKNFYTYIIKRINPDYVLVADPGEFYVFAAAKERKIPVIELQHGMFDRYHFTYSWHKNAQKYKSHMPIPEKIFVYGEHSKKELEHLGFWKDESVITGNLRIDQYRKQKTKISKNNICTLTFASQGIDRERVINLLDEFLKLTANSVEIILNIKLHPVYESNIDTYFKSLGHYKNVNILPATSLQSTFELICKSHFHMSISSTTHYEAIALNVPTIILPFATSELVESLSERGHATRIQNANDLYNIVANPDTYQLSQDIGEYYFKSNAVENMKRELGWT